MTGVPGSTQIERAPGIVWRLTSDRVMTHRIDAPPTTAAHDLIGPIALVWLALDEPATPAELATRMADAGVFVDDLDDEIGRLVDAGFVVAIAPKASA